jgi:hypothetical protein
VISEWVGQWAYDENFEVDFCGDGDTEEYPLIRELAGFEITAIKLRKLYVWSKTALAVLKHNS